MKKFITFVLALGFMGCLYAQAPKDPSEAAVQKDIVDLKKSGKIIYADSYEGKMIVDRAKMMKRNKRKIEEMIQMFLVEELGMSYEDAKEMYDFLDDKLQNVERDIDGKTIAHMFTYISKESIKDLVKKTNHDFSGISDYVNNPDEFVLDPELQKKVDELEYSSKHFGGEETKKLLAQADAAEAATPSVPGAAAATPAPATPAPVPATPAAPVAPAVPETPAVVETPVAPVEPATPAVPATPVVAETPAAAPAPVVAPATTQPNVVAVQAPAPVKKEEKVEVLTQPDIVKKIIAASGSQSAVGRLMKLEAANGNIKYGNAKVMANMFAACIIAVLERDTYNVVAVLSPQSGYRFDYLTGYKRTDSDYDPTQYAKIYILALK